MRRKVKSGRLTPKSFDLTMVSGMDTFFIFMPLLWKLCEGKIEGKDFFDAYDKQKNEIMQQQRIVKSGFD